MNLAAWRARDAGLRHIPGLWEFSVHLSCGHEVEYGIVHTDEISDLTPRRKDHHFGALTCPGGCGRRRVTSTTSSAVVFSPRAIKTLEQA